nr:hypothetical protein [Kibdelosporangium phytohabitans]
MVALLLAGCGVQPTAPIGGSRATGAVIYLVQDGEVTPVLRPTRHESSKLSALELLAEGATPGGLYTTEVPRELGPRSVDGVTVTVTADVAALSTVAVTQIVCTAAIPQPVTLRGGGQTRGPLSCPV